MPPLPKARFEEDLGAPIEAPLPQAHLAREATPADVPAQRLAD